MTENHRQVRADYHELSDRAVTIISVLLAIHFIIVFLCGISNYVRSAMQQRLVTLISPYTQPLALDWNYTPFYLTHGTEMDMDYRLEYRAAGSTSWLVLDNKEWRGCEARARFARWGRFLAFHAMQDVDEVPARMMVSAALFIRHKFGQLPDRLRLRRHDTRPWEAAAQIDMTRPDDPYDEQYFTTVYEVAVLTDTEGRVRVAPIDPQAKPAPAELVP
ncbi:MAG: hypothetical protein KatS3mg109_0683 [Pirellulaceae bacterium]|nr:MAG: hypothetical protein KatS3mg109_0683 [Pirellulaceae bacterium]